MQLSGLGFHRSPSQSRTVIIFVLLILVTNRVQSQCFEEDCRANHSVKAVNTTTGECIICFPCLVCEDSTTVPSVPCGARVPFGTQIQCVPRQLPNHVSVSKASAYTTSMPFISLVTSPSVTSWHSHFTGIRQTTVIPTKSSTQLMVIPGTSSTYPGSSAKPQKATKKQDHAVVYILRSGAALGIILFFAVRYRLWKRKSRQSQLPNTSSTTTDIDPCSAVSHAHDRSACTVYPGKDRAEFSRSRPKDVSQQGNINRQFQPEVHPDAPEERAVPPSLDVTNSGGDKADGGQMSDDVCLLDLSQDSPINSQLPTEITLKGIPSLHSGASIVTSSVNILLQPTSTFSQPATHFVPSYSRQPEEYLNIENGVTSDLNEQREVKWQALPQADKYSIKLQEVPVHLQLNICLTLDIMRVEGNDVRAFSEKLGITTKEFECFQQAAIIKKTTTTSVVIEARFLVKKPSGTVGDFVDMMKDIGRDDIIHLINSYKE